MFVLRVRKCPKIFVIVGPFKKKSFKRYDMFIERGNASERRVGGVREATKEMEAWI